MPDPKKKKDDDEAEDETAKASSSIKLAPNTAARAAQKKAIGAERAAANAKATEAMAPWLLHDSKSSLSLGDASTVARMQREEGLSKENAERKLKWQKDMKKTGATVGQASAQLSKP